MALCGDHENLLLVLLAGYKERALQLVRTLLNRKAAKVVGGCSD